MKTIDTAQLKSLITCSEGNIILINTLPEARFSETEIPGSINIPVGSDDFVDRVKGETGSQVQPVVLYCAGPKCDAASQAGRLLSEAEFSTVFVYEGGVELWQREGNPLAQHS